MVRFQIMTYNTNTGCAIKSVFELIFFFFLIFPSFPVIMLHPSCKLTACILTFDILIGVA